MKKSEISIPEIISVIFRRKWIIVIAVVLSILAALLYNFIKDPVFQSSVLLKKEIIFDKNTQQDRIQSILALRSQDELETEMQLVHTRNIINRVIDELSLNIFISKIIEQDGTVTIIDLPLSEYKNNFNLELYPKSFPQINDIDIGLRTVKSDFIIKKNDKEGFNLLNKKNKNILSDSKKISDIPKSDWKLDFIWPNENIGEIHFKTLDYNDVYKNLSSNIFTDKKIKTNIFEIGARSNYPHLTKQIANQLADKLKESRVGLQKENIKYTFNFIDERLQEVSEKLSNAENELSYFKSQEQIVQIDEQSKKLIEFISNLESVKFENDLELSQYNNKLENISKKIRTDGYIDQTYLTPEKYQNISSPFSNLLDKLSKLEVKKLDLLQKRTELHPEVVLLTEQIGKIKQELNKFNKNTVEAYKIITNTLDKKKQDINSLILKYSAKLENLPNQEAKLASLIRKRDAYEKMYTLLLDKREEMRVAELSRMQDLIILDYAVEATKPITPNKLINLLSATIFGVILGLFGVLIAQVSDQKVNDVIEIERDFNYPILSVIPPYEKDLEKTISSSERVKDKFVTMMDDQFRYKEAYRTFETKLTSKLSGSPKKIMITSCEENAGKTSAAANLAISAAQSGKKVLLIDCDIKNPSIAEVFGLPKFSSGLVDYLIEKTDTPNIYKPVKLTNDSNLLLNLDIIPTGVFTNISGEILASETMSKLIDNVDYYDFVILDTPPITRLSDALSLGRIVKDTVLVVRAGQTVKESISWAISELNTSDINFHGLLVNDCNVKSNSYKYQYGYTHKGK